MKSLMEGQIAVLALGPIQRVVFFLSHDLLEQLGVVLQEVGQGGVQLAVVIPQTHIVGKDGGVGVGNQLAVALFLHVLHILYQAGNAAAAVAQAGIGVGADHAGGLFHLRDEETAVAADGAHAQPVILTVYFSAIAP